MFNRLFPKQTLNFCFFNEPRGLFHLLRKIHWTDTGCRMIPKQTNGRKVFSRYRWQVGYGRYFWLLSKFSSCKFATVTTSKKILKASHPPKTSNWRFSWQFWCGWFPSCNYCLFKTQMGACSSYRKKLLLLLSLSANCTKCHHYYKLASWLHDVDLLIKYTKELLTVQYIL